QSNFLAPAGAQVVPNSVRVDGQTTSSGQSGKSGVPLIAVIIPSVVGGVLLLVVVIIIVYVIVARKRKSRMSRREFDALSAEMSMYRLTPQTSRKTVGGSGLSEEDIVRGERLGSWSYGTIYKGKLRGRMEEIVCIKVLDDPNRTTALARESSILAMCDHPNVLKYFGSISDTCSVVKFMNGGSLLNVLHNTTNFSPNEYRKMCTDIAAGMSYLESQKIIHSNLCAKHVLCKRDEFGGFQLIISGFTYAEKGEAVNGLIHQRMDTPFAPELLLFDGPTHKSDVWSFGVVCTEIFNEGRQPYQDKPDAEITFYVQNGGSPKIPTNTSGIISEIMRACLQRRPSDRPSFIRVYQELRADKGTSRQKNWDSEGRSSRSLY
ncbi:tyrosine-protein kinase Fps85D-like isoform 2, partial [Planoprotostelium fungivorum]